MKTRRRFRSLRRRRVSDAEDVEEDAAVEQTNEHRLKTRLLPVVVVGDLRPHSTRSSTRLERASRTTTSLTRSVRIPAEMKIMVETRDQVRVVVKSSNHHHHKTTSQSRGKRFRPIRRSAKTSPRQRTTSSPSCSRPSHRRHREGEPPRQQRKTMTPKRLYRHWGMRKTISYPSCSRPSPHRHEPTAQQQRNLS